MLFFIAAILHIFSVKLTLFPGPHLLLDFYKVPSLIFAVISIISLLALCRKMDIVNLVVIMLPFTIISILASLFIQSPIAKIISEQGVITHIILSVLAYSLLTLATAQALLLAYQEHFLKQHTFNGLFRYLPPLQTMDKMLIELIIYGFIFLTLSILSGFIFLDDMFAQHLIHKSILSLLAWVIFAFFLFGHFAFGWRGTTAAKLTIIGFIVLMLSYFGSKFALEIILKRQ